MRRPAAPVLAVLVGLLTLAGCANGTVTQLPAAPTTVGPVSTTTVVEAAGGPLALSLIHI